MARRDDYIVPLSEQKVSFQTMEEVMHNSMMPYAEHVILERALPRVEDGLKPCAEACALRYVYSESVS